MTHDCDALVIGGGPAGAAAGWLLARAGWSVVVCERKSFPRRKVCGEYLSATNLPLLDRLGIGDEFRQRAGPQVRRVGVFAGRHSLYAKLPQVDGDYGRALGREHLDTLLLARARQAGAEVLQPWHVNALHGEPGRIHAEGPPWIAEVRCSATEATGSLRSQVVIAAHGSWDVGELPTQPRRAAQRPSDLLGFKAHFANCNLAPALMPLLAFPGGYGGMVHCDDGRVSLSCCIRRDVLPVIRDATPASAGEAVESYIRDQCAGVRQALIWATRLGPWLATGPIRPGIRLGSWRGLFEVGNCAGEAHPVVAEGISMALQSAWLLTDRLIAWKRTGGQVAQLAAVYRAYTTAWRRAFEPRLRVAAMVAHWAMRPAVVAGTMPILLSCPQLLTWMARWTGKARRVV